MNSRAFNSGKWLGLCIPLLLLGALLLPSQRSQAVPNNPQSDKQGKRKISLRSSMPKGIKVVGMRNYDDDKWYEKLEFEIRNESGKDIWYMEFMVWLPEFTRKGPVDEVPAFITKFGTRADNTPSEEELKNSNKPLLHPGQEYVFRIPQFQVENFKKTYSPDRATVPSVGHLQFQLYIVFFTDGTGFVGGRASTLKDGRISTAPNGIVLSPSLPAPKRKSISLTKPYSSSSSFFCQNRLRRLPGVIPPHSGVRAILGKLTAATIEFIRPTVMCLRN